MKDPDLDYFNKINIFWGEQNTQEWSQMFKRLVDKYGSVQPNPVTGLGIFLIENSSDKT